MSFLTSKTVLSAFALSPRRIGGLETYAAELSARLADAGWNSLLVFLEPPSKEVEPLFNLPNTRVEVLEGCGRRSFSPLYRLAKLACRVRPRIVHFHLIDACNGYPWLAKLCLGKRVFLTDHISRPSGYSPIRSAPWKRPLFRLAYLPVNKVICVSSYVSRCACAEFSLPARQVAVVYNGVDISRAERSKPRREEFRRRYGIPLDKIVVLQASYVIPEKGVDVLLRAAQRVVQAGDNVHFVIAGDGAMRGEYEQLTKQLGIEGRVSFLGLVNDPLGEGLYAACDIACQASRWQEAFGLTIAEAMASKKPLVATRVGGIPELVEHGVSGFLVHEGDDAELAGKICILAADPALRESMGKAGNRICQTKFNITRNVKQLMEIYGL